MKNHTDSDDEYDFVQLIEDNKLRFYKTAKIILKNDDDIYDAIQESLISMYKNYDTLKDKSVFASWATRIIINKCYDLLRKKKRDNTEDVDEIIDTSMEISYYDNYDDDKYGIKKAMEFLSEDQKLVTTLYYYDDYSVKEIAEILGIQEGTVKSRLSKSREILKNKLGKEEI